MRSMYRAMTLVEVVVAVAIFAFAAVMTLQMVLATSQNFDAEMNQSEAHKRTAGRLYAMMTDLGTATPTPEEEVQGIKQVIPKPSFAQNTSFCISKQGTPINLVTSISTPYSDGEVIPKTSGSPVGDSITFRPAVGSTINAQTGQADTAWGNPIRYRWVPLVRAGMDAMYPDGSPVGMLVKETLDSTGTSITDTEVLEENVPQCDYTYDLTQMPPKYPTGFAVIQAALETSAAGSKQLVARRRSLTISLQRQAGSQIVLTGTFVPTSTSTVTSTATDVSTSTTVETIFLQNP